MNESLKKALQKASSECSWPGEEEGGIIVQKDDDFLFIKLTNANTGTEVAAALYTVNKTEYGEKIISLFDKGWKSYASFHTHPDGCLPNPSRIDLNQLFKGFPINYIYSPWTRLINCYTNLLLYKGITPTTGMYVSEDKAGNMAWVKEKVFL